MITDRVLPSTTTQQHWLTTEAKNVENIYNKYRHAYSSQMGDIPPLQTIVHNYPYRELTTKTDGITYGHEQGSMLKP